MKTIQSSKDITTLELDDKVVFGDLKYIVCREDGYFLRLSNSYDYDKIFTILHISKRDFVKNLGINTLPIDWNFPETLSLEALTAIVSALFKEYEKQKELPKTWEEFCDKYPITPDEYWIETVYSRYCNGLRERKRDVHMDKNVCVSLQEAEAHTALMQLRQLRKCYIGDWKPNWNGDSTKFCIIVDTDRIRVTDSYFCQRSLSFPTYELAEQFLTNFKDLLEIAKPLL